MEHTRSLNTLPSELVAHISAYLCPADDSNSQRVLSQLTLTCKKLKHELQPILFRAYTHGSQPVSRLVKFLRAIASRPDLAAAVTKLVFHEPIKSTALSNTEKEFVDTCIANLGLPLPRTDWHLEGETRHTILETVMVYCPNLQTLEFQVNEEWRLNILDSIHNAHNPIEFLRLRTLDISYYYISGDHWAIDYGQISPLLEASPNLEHLTLPTLEGFYDGQQELPSLKSVKTLDLGESSSGAFFVASIITSCESLQSFTMHWIRSTGYDESHEDWTVIEIWDALEGRKQTLEEITFESTIDIPLGSPTADTLSSFAGFTALRALKTDGRSFEAMFQAWMLKTGGVEGVDNMDEFVEQLLPPGIRQLTIWEPGHVLIPALLALARGRRSRGLYESLVMIEIGPSPLFKHWMARPEWPGNEGLLREEFARAGVELKTDIPHVPPEMLNLMMLGGFLR